jgi:hypothetical protein
MYHFSATSKSRSSAAVVTNFASAAIIADFGSFAKFIIHFCPFRGVSGVSGKAQFCTAAASCHIAYNVSGGK